MSTSAKCRVKGCPGIVRITTDGLGRAVDQCDLCDRRQAWAEQNTPKFPPTICRICGGRVTVTPRTRHRKYCDACVVVAKQVERVREHVKRAEKKRGILPIAPRRSA